MILQIFTKCHLDTKNTQMQYINLLVNYHRSLSLFSRIDCIHLVLLTIVSQRSLK